METNNLTPFNLPADTLVKIIKNSGNRNFSETTLKQHVNEGFICNDNGTIDLFDYVSWLLGDARRNPPPRTPPTEMFNLQSVPPAMLAGWLTLYNHMGYEITAAKITRLFQTFGFKFKAKDNEKNIDFIKFAAFATANKKQKPASTSLEGYLAHKAEMNRRNKEASALGRDIGDLPEVVNPEIKEKCEYDFKLFCETYFPETFALDWSDDHIKCIGKIEKSIIEGGLFALAMPRGSGKALAIDTPLPTPTGWTTMGEVKIGDTLFDENGYQCRVILKSEVFTDHKCYEVTFNDGSTIVCDADHLWQVEDIYGRKNPYVRTTEWLSTRYNIGKRGHHESRFRIPVAKPLQIQDVCDLPISPYALGVWLGDGASANAKITLCSTDADEISHNIISELGNEWLYESLHETKGNSKDFVLSKSKKKSCSAQARLRALNLIDNKHIPSCYLRAEYENRLSLLQGLLDTDGYVDNNGHIEICIKRDNFADNFEELLSSLGILYRRGKKKVLLDSGKIGIYNRFYFIGYQDQNLFRLKRKQERLAVRPAKKMTKSGLCSHTPCTVRMITDIHEVPTVKTQCVMVDSPSHLYLAGKQMIPTHNTTLCEIACIWALLYGHRKFVTLIGATESAALEMLDSIKIEFETNENLSADFPEVCFPIESLQGIANRCNGQTYHGVRTRITWSSNELILPTIENSLASGNVIRTAGLTGRIRGMKYKRPDGKTVRPDLVVIDDPQTRESARSLEQNKTRIKILGGDVLGLAGPSKKISGIMPCTVIEPGDMADTILDREKHPEWNGERAKMMYELPANMNLWDEYAEIYADSMREDGNFLRATKFYEANREEMDRGAVIAWKSRYNQDEISAVQNAMNIMFTDPVTFRAEYQNEPLKEDLTEESIMTADAIASKLNGIEKDKVPLACSKITMFVDVQKKCLFYTICAWADDFTGAVIDYGTFPEQRARRFTLESVKPSLQEMWSHSSIEGQIFAGLKALFEKQMQRIFIREDGAEMKIDKAAIDANWGISTDIVYQFCRQTEFSSLVQPAHGRYVGASSKPMTSYKKKPGEKLGLNWYIPAMAGKRAIRHVVFDTNFWKSFIHSRLNVDMGNVGCLSLWGRQPITHELFSEHLTAEFKVRTQGRERTVDEWRLRPGRSDNHWLDCITGCAMLASQLGSALPESTVLTVNKKPLKLSERKGNDTISAEMPVFVPPGNEKKPRLKLSALRR